jgi:hypothetical protein
MLWETFWRWKDEMKESVYVDARSLPKFGIDPATGSIMKLED